MKRRGKPLAPITWFPPSRRPRPRGVSFPAGAQAACIPAQWPRRRELGTQFRRDCMTSMNQVSSFGASEKRRTVRQIDCFAGRLDCQAAAAFAAYPNWWPASTSSFSITTLTAAPSPRPLLHSILENLARLCSRISGAQRQPGCGPPCELEAHSDRGPRQRRKRSIPANASHVQ
jgi:hypothetical protein